MLDFGFLDLFSLLSDRLRLLQKGGLSMIGTKVDVEASVHCPGQTASESKKKLEKELSESGLFCFVSFFKSEREFLIRLHLPGDYLLLAWC